MTLFDENLKNIALKELLSLVIILFLIQFILNYLNIIQIDSVWIYIIVIFYFIFKLRNQISTIGPDIKSVFTPDLFKNILLIVVLNIFLSYALLYLSDFILKAFPASGFLVGFHLPVHAIVGGSFIATVLISPISEELIFRGVFLNRLKYMVPLIFSVLISSCFFAALHTYGSVFSAFVFSICMCILYLRTNNIFVPITAHFLNNLFAEIIVNLDADKVLFTNHSVMGIVSLLGIISFFLILSKSIPELNSIK